MAAGGIYDHLGGGFARYSTDRHWLVPHFEKMLYDNALLARVYLHAWQLTGADSLPPGRQETLDYLLRPPMRLAGRRAGLGRGRRQRGRGGPLLRVGRSRGARGRRPGRGGLVRRHARAGNWEGHNILFRPLGAPSQRPPEVEAARQALFDRREQRVRPGLDDKVLTEWNAMAVAALAEAGAALGAPDWVAAAEELGDFLLGHPAPASDGRWLRSWQGGRGAATWPTPPTTPGWSRRSSAWPRRPAGPGGSPQPAPPPDALLDLFWDGDDRGAAHDRPRTPRP